MHHFTLYHCSGARCVLCWSEWRYRRPILSAEKDSTESIDFSNVQIVHKYEGITPFNCHNSLLTWVSLIKGLALDVHCSAVNFLYGILSQGTIVPALCDGEICIVLYSFFWTQYQHVTDRQTDRQTGISEHWPPCACVPSPLLNNAE